MNRNLLPIVPVALAMLFAVCAAVCDLRTRRIPNRLILLCMPAALISQFAAAGWRGVASGIAATGIALLVMSLGFVLGGVGAGDVKLISAMGAFAGLHALALLIIATALAGGIFGLFVIAYRIYAERTRSGFEHRTAMQVRSVSIPYALPVACGVLAVFWHVLRSIA